jgi:hypothetical protein
VFLTLVRRSSQVCNVWVSEEGALTTHLALG